jgi:hypothetical protein
MFFEYSFERIYDIRCNTYYGKSSIVMPSALDAHSLRSARVNSQVWEFTLIFYAHVCKMPWMGILWAKARWMLSISLDTGCRIWPGRHLQVKN